jgi:methyl-accepting chemotaxis protein
MLKKQKFLIQISVILCVNFVSFILISAFYLYEEQTLNNIDEKMLISMEAAEAASSLNSDFLKVFPTLNNFFASPSDKGVSAFQKLKESIDLDIKTLNKVTRETKEIKELENQATYIQGEFGKLVEIQRQLGFDENSGIQGQLRQDIHTVEQQLNYLLTAPSQNSNVTPSQLLVQLLMMRRHEKDFILRGEKETYSKKIEANKNLFLNILSSSSFPNTEKDNLKKHLNNYITSFNIFSELLEKIRAKKDILAEEISYTTEIVEAFAKSQDKKYLNLQAEFHTFKNELEFKILIAAILSISLSIFIGLQIALQVSKNLGKNINDLKFLSEGNTDLEIEVLDYNNEVGDLTRTLAVFKNNLLENENMREQQKAHEKQVLDEQRKALNEMAEVFEGEVGTVIETVLSSAQNLGNASSQLLDSVNYTNIKTQEVSNLSHLSSQNVQTVASATDELSCSIQEINRQVKSSTDMSNDAVILAEKTTRTMSKLSNNVSQIGQILTLITDIAEQTNLLALNATIEAARAGEAGKGFAVVASEVKNLANQTSQATSQIHKQIELIIDGTSQSEEAIGSISTVIENINHISASIASAVTQQESATNEIAKNVNEVSNSTESVSEQIKNVEHRSHQTGEAANSIENASAHLTEQARHLGEKVDAFLQRVRSDA